jgi:hypothetical protein
MVIVSVTGLDCAYKMGILPLFPPPFLSICALPQPPKAMAITRRGYREVSRSNSRCLRTRVITAPAIAIRPLVRKSQQSNMKCIIGGIETESNDKNYLELRIK